MTFSLKHAGSISVLLALLTAWPFYLYYSNDLRVVERNFEDLLRHVRKSEVESLPVSGGKVYKALTFFSNDAHVIPGEPYRNAFSRAEMKTLLLQARQQADRIKISSRGAEISRLDDASIRMDVTLELTLDGSAYNERFFETYRFRWIMEDDEWRIAMIAPLDVITHPLK